MSSQPNSSAAMQRAAATRSAAPRAPQGKVAQGQAELPRTLLFGSEEASVLKLDLSDIALPKVGDLNVEGFKPSFFARLFGKR